MIFAAIDPGSVNAAIAVYHDGTPVMIDDLRVVDKMISAALLANVLKNMKVETVVVENVHSMPKQGVSSMFKFGMGCGIIHGVAGALRLPVTLVTPTQWKGFFSIGPDKERARELSIRLYPHLNRYLQRKKDVNRAEALLIGSWYYQMRIVRAP